LVLGVVGGSPLVSGYDSSDRGWRRGVLMSSGLGYKSEQWGMGRLVMPSGKIDTRQAVLKFPPAAKNVLLLVKCGVARFSV
jgi:hypothetical protein